MPVILATHKEEIRRISVQGQPRQIVPSPCFEKAHQNKRLVEWLKV
jgi:hypothetical protein